MNMYLRLNQHINSAGENCGIDSRHIWILRHKTLKSRSKVLSKKGIDLMNFWKSKAFISSTFHLFPFLFKLIFFTFPNFFIKIYTFKTKTLLLYYQRVPYQIRRYLNIPVNKS